MVQISAVIFVHSEVGKYCAQQLTTAVMNKKSALSVFFGFKGTILNQLPADLLRNYLSFINHVAHFSYINKSYNFQSKLFCCIFKVCSTFFHFLFTLAKLKLKAPKDICFKSKHQVEKIWVVPETEIEHISPECFLQELLK